MIVCDRHKYVFIAVPKTASISIQFSLGYGDDSGHKIPEPDLYHQGIQDVLVDNPHASEYFRFAFVRNPWDRILSLYKDFTLKRVYQYSGKVIYDKPLLSEFTNFEDMCLRLSDSPWCDNIFFRSQTKLLSIDGKLAMDFFGKFEHLARDFNYVCTRLGLTDIDLLKLNTGIYSGSYHCYYTAPAKNAIAELYRDDIENFNYDF